MKKVLPIFIFLSSILILSSCSNKKKLSDDDFSKIRVGQSINSVKDSLGTPHKIITGRDARANLKEQQEDLLKLDIEIGSEDDTTFFDLATLSSIVLEQEDFIEQWIYKYDSDTYDIYVNQEEVVFTVNAQNLN